VRKPYSGSAFAPDLMMPTAGIFGKLDEPVVCINPRQAMTYRLHSHIAKIPDLKTFG
jgi:hypothetical protein